MGLFRVLFLRVMAVIAAALLVMTLLSHMFQIHYLERSWRTDLQQEAIWTARHFGIAEMGDGRAERAVPPEALARAWRSMHESVRLVVRDERGAVVLDSHPGTPAPMRDSPGLLTGYAEVERPEGMWELVLSRPRPPAFPADASGGTLGAALAVIALAAALIFPLTRELAHALSALGDQARRVASGEFGAPLPVKGPRELKQLAAAFNEMSSRLREEEESRRRLTADVSHELRSPLGRLRALAETIGRHPDEATKLITQSEAEIVLLERLIADLIDTARLEQGEADLRLEPTPVRAWWDESVMRLGVAVESAGLKLIAEAAGGDAVLMLDRQRLFQAFSNIVDNAVAASRGVTDAPIEASLQTEEDEWRIEVRDRGRGIPAEATARVFDRFYRVETDRGRRTGGVGLGLSIAKAIVEAHGGAIVIDSPPGRGTLVRMTFPRR